MGVFNCMCFPKVLSLQVMSICLTPATGALIRDQLPGLMPIRPTSLNGRPVACTESPHTQKTNAPPLPLGCGLARKPSAEGRQRIATKNKKRARLLGRALVQGAILWPSTHVPAWRYQDCLTH
jgi:hypothetical protein